jgi:hypothetical protein
VELERRDLQRNPFWRQLSPRDLGQRRADVARCYRTPVVEAAEEHLGAVMLGFDVHRG